MELSKRSNAKLEEANEEELRQNKAIGKLIYCPYIFHSTLVSDCSPVFSKLPEFGHFNNQCNDSR